jgi:iron complex outermembrane receptor protein
MKPRVLAITLALALAAQGSVPARADAPADTLPGVVPVAGVEVSTARAGDRAPLARTTLTREDLARVNWGQDTPMALATLPGAYAYSDAGNGIGYSYLSIRGFPQRRISVLINGVPLNDPESHEVYWIDHPDLLASTSEAQVQRGVGSALYGAASLGGSVNLETGPLGETPHATVLVAVGSWDTRRIMAEMNSGRLAGGWDFYGRYSRIETQGYRERSDSRLWSYALAVRKLAGAHAFRINLYGGPEETHLAYLGVDESYMNGLVSGDRDRDRRFNPLTYPGERDHFFEPHYELIHTWSPRAGLTASQTLFSFDGRGYYDEQRLNDALADYRLAPWATFDPTLFGADSLLYYRDADQNGVLDRDAQGRVTVEKTDLVRRRVVVNRHYGWVPRVRLEHARGVLTLGGELRQHDGHHYGEVVSGSGFPPGTPPDAPYYDYHPRTLAAGLYAREELRLAKSWTATADLAWRHEDYFMREDQFDGIQFEQHYDFALPRLGLTFAPSASFSTFASWAYSAREPAFRDLYDGEGAGSVPNFQLVNGVPDYAQPRVRPEKVNDYELGATWNATALSASANLFRMDFSDELVYSGQFNTDLGYAVTGNAARSIHQGAEIAARVTGQPGGGPRVTLDANATLSDNHFVSYTEYAPTGDSTLVERLNQDGKAIGLFPALLGNAGLRAEWRAFRLGAEAQAAGRLYLDNSETRAASAAPRAVLNLNAGYRLRFGTTHADFSLRVLNLLDQRYVAGGYAYRWAYATYVAYIPAATRNALAELRLEF